MPEKRSKDRVRKRIQVRYGPDGPDKMAFAADVSASGVQLKTNNVLRPGTTVQVELKFPDRTFNLWARVAWAKQVPPQLAHTSHCGMGLKFIEPGPEWERFFAAFAAPRR